MLRTTGFARGIHVLQSNRSRKKKSTDRKQISRARNYFSSDDFHFDEATGKLMCPAGKAMKSRCPNFQTGPKGYRGSSYIGETKNCFSCDLRARCIRNPNTKARQVAELQQGIRDQKKQQKDGHR
jgi:hypothetical protein